MSSLVNIGPLTAEDTKKEKRARRKQLRKDNPTVRANHFRRRAEYYGRLSKRNHDLALAAGQDFHLSHGKDLDLKAAKDKYLSLAFKFAKKSLEHFEYAIRVIEDKNLSCDFSADDIRKHLHTYCLKLKVKV